MTIKLSLLAVLSMACLITSINHYNKYKEYKSLVGEVSTAAANKRYHLHMASILLIGWLVPAIVLVYTVIVFLF